LIHPEVLNDKQQGTEILKFIEGQLKVLNSSLPKDKLELLHQVRIWVEHDGKAGGAAFHPSALWLKRNGHNPEKAGGIEISNARNYVLWSRDRMVSGILHEMSHALHALHLAEKNAAIRAAYDHAMEQKLYASVAFVEVGRIREGTRQAYAMTNEKEYFAEISEAYFGRNDFFPFNRNQLKAYDPVGFELVREAWLRPVPMKAGE
jgi:hypothetical protein